MIVLLLKGGTDYELSQKEIEIKWAEAKSGRWFTFANYHTLKQSQIETGDTLWYMDALYSPVRSAQAYYKKMLTSQYQDVLPKDVQRYLDSIYPILYKEMDEKMSNNKYMDNLHVEYKKLVIERMKKPPIKKLNKKIWDMSIEELYEYVYNIRLDLDNNSYELSDWRTDRRQTSVDMSLGWSNNNVDIGYVHTYPSI